MSESPVSDSSLVDDALMARLINDAQLKALLPDGVWWDAATEGKTRVCIVSLVEHSGNPVFNGRGWDSALYLVKAVMLNSSSVNIAAAAKRIDDLLDTDGKGTVIDIPNYGQAASFRESRVRMTERDDQNAAVRWLHRGGRYRVQASESS